MYRFCFAGTATPSSPETGCLGITALACMEDMNMTGSVTDMGMDNGFHRELWGKTGLYEGYHVTYVPKPAPPFQAKSIMTVCCRVRTSGMFRFHSIVFCAQSLGLEEKLSSGVALFAGVIRLSSCEGPSTPVSCKREIRLCP